MEFEVKESVSVKDGMHEGVVVAIEYRNEPYEYVDVVIEEAETKFRLKKGYPQSAVTDSKFMRMLKRFTEIKPGLKVDPEVVLKDKAVSFLTMTEQKGEKKFTRIVDGSLKPKIQTEQVQ